MTGVGHYADHPLKPAREAFKAGGQFQSMPDRIAVTDATHTARISRHRREDGELVDCVNVYLKPEDVPDELRDVADHYGLEQIHRDGEQLVFADAEVTA